MVIEIERVVATDEGYLTPYFWVSGISPDAFKAAAATDEWRQITQVHYDPDSSESLTATLVTAIADARGVDPLDYDQMPPLYDAIDPTSLENTLFERAQSNRLDRDAAGVILFRYGEHMVTLQGDGWISICEPH